MSSFSADLGRLAALAVASLTLAACGSSQAPGEAGEASSSGPPAAAAASVPSGWSQAGAGPARTRVSPDPGPEEPPGILWSGLIDSGIATEPVVASAGEIQAVLVAGPSNLRAIDLENGRELWEAPLPGATSASPVAWDGLAWIGTLDGEGRLLHGADGSEAGAYEVDFTLAGAPLVDGGLLIFEETSVSGRPNESRLHALDPRSLEPRWTHDFSAAAGRAPASDGERVYVHAHDGVFAVRLADGSPAWSWSREAHRQVFGPAVAGGRVVVHSSPAPPGGSLTALDASTGELRWQRTLPRRFAGPPALDEDAIYATVLPGALHCLDASTGELRWEQALPARAESAPAVGARRVFTGGVGFVAAFDRATGEPVWRLDIDGEVASLSVQGERLLVATWEGFVHALGASR